MGRRLLGWATVAVWAALLLALHAPWRALGGIAGERLRWLERWALAGGVIVGAWAGAELRSRGGRLVRPALLAPVAAAALAALGLELAGAGLGALVAASAATAYVAGFDVGYRIWPVSLARPVESEESERGEELDPD